MDSSPYKEAAMALTDFLSSALKFMTIYIPQKQAKENLLQLSEKIKRAGSVREITDLKKEYRKIILKADPPASTKEKEEEHIIDREPTTASPSVKKEPAPIKETSFAKKTAQDISVINGVKKKTSSIEVRQLQERENIDVGLMEESEILDHFLGVLSKLLSSLKGKSTDDTVKMKIDSLVKRLPEIKRLDEMKEFEKNVHGAIYSKTFMDDRTHELFEEIFKAMMMSTLLWVDKNSIIERRIQKASDASLRISDPWLLKDLAISIKNFFFSKKQEVFILGQEREKLKSIIISLIRTLQDVAERNHLFMENMEQYAETLEEAEELREFEKIKTSIVFEVGKLKKKTDGIEEEINKVKVKLLSARSSIRSMEEELEKAKEESLRDPLTGVFSRAVFEDNLEKLILHVKKTHEPFGVLLCDMDRFSTVNTTYGNAVGNEILKALVKDIGEGLNEEDFLARFGGNSFAIVLHKMGNNNLKDMAEKIRDTIRNHEFHIESKKLSITTSVVAIKATEEDTAESVINRLRELLQEVKNHGGNRCAFGPLEL